MNLSARTRLRALCLATVVVVITLVTVFVNVDHPKWKDARFGDVSTALGAIGSLAAVVVALKLAHDASTREARWRKRENMASALARVWQAITELHADQALMQIPANSFPTALPILSATAIRDLIGDLDGGLVGDLETQPLLDVYVEILRWNSWVTQQPAPCLIPPPLRAPLDEALSRSLDALHNLLTSPPS